MGPSRDGHRPGLELLRGLAALAVCLGHVRAFLLPPFRSGGYAGWETPLFFFSAQGEFAVWIFLVLSGYLVGGSVLHRRAAGNWSWSDYLLRRGTRLWVVLVPALAVTWLCDASRGNVPADSAGAMVAGVDSPHDARTLLGNLFFLQDVVVAPYGSNTPLWSLAYEFWFYLLFPAALVVMADQGWWRRVAAVLVAGGILWLVGPRGWGLAIPWLSGAALARYTIHRPGQVRPGPRGLPWGGLAAVLLLIPFLPAGGKFLALPLVTVATAWTVWGESGRPELAGPPVAWLGKISYTLYAVHMPIAVLLTSAVAGPGLLVAGPGRWLVVLGVTAALVLLACPLWWAFEGRTEAIRVALKRRFPLAP
ncbi:hypothetical protein LBMAG55_03690 [Verrucomicrobiota bacterium]|nr:hypothetical protein EMGBD4_13020 [Verrucomicrobiota bacterium]GDY17046.1 hypothetical protein LBMAG55_03690 [Verrucomicrobiota bacterium]